MKIEELKAGDAFYITRDGGKLMILTVVGIRVFRFNPSRELGINDIRVHVSTIGGEDAEVDRVHSDISPVDLIDQLENRGWMPL